MAILKATILARINKICSRAETDIDDILLEALQEISQRTLSLKTSASGTTTEGLGYITKPTGMLESGIESVNYGGVDLKPVSWDQFIRGNIRGWCIYGNNFYFSTLTASQAYTIYYAQIHPDDLDSILFTDEFLKAIVRLTAAKLYEKYELYDKVQAQYTLYEDALNKISTGTTPPICAYNGQEL